MNRYLKPKCFKMYISIMLLLGVFCSPVLSSEGDINKKIAEKQRQFEEKTREQQKEMIQQKEKAKKEFDRRLETLYSQAIKLYKDEFFWQAKEVFEDIELLSPGYRGTKSYLAKIEGKIQRQARDVQAKEKRKKKASRKDIISEELDHIDHDF